MIFISLFILLITLMFVINSVQKSLEFFCMLYSNFLTVSELMKIQALTIPNWVSALTVTLLCKYSSHFAEVYPCFLDLYFNFMTIIIWRINNYYYCSQVYVFHHLFNDVAINYYYQIHVFSLSFWYLKFDFFWCSFLAHILVHTLFYSLNRCRSSMFSANITVSSV